MTILLTGASSFTGAWFARALVASGHHVVATCTHAREAYEDMRRRRVEQVAADAEVVFECAFGTRRFLDVLDGCRPAALCHHGAVVTNYKSWGFDWTGAIAATTFGLPAVLEAFRAGGGALLVVTGSVFEGGEGAGEPPGLAISPYGLSKQLTAVACQFWAHRFGVRFAKFVIPNPFGPLEEPRFTAYLVREWRAGRVPVIATPDYVRDNIHVDLLARCYATFVSDQLAARGPSRMAPSGYVERQGDFGRRFAAEMRRRANWAGDVEFAPQTAFDEPRMRVNTEPATGIVDDWSESAAWDALAAFYSES